MLFDGRFRTPQKVKDFFQLHSDVFMHHTA
jgi:hypothetical protein